MLPTRLVLSQLSSHAMMNASHMSPHLQRVSCPLSPSPSATCRSSSGGSEALCFAWYRMA